jgi:hypothetical protein
LIESVEVYPITLRVVSQNSALVRIGFFFKNDPIQTRPNRVRDEFGQQLMLEFYQVNITSEVIVSLAADSKNLTVRITPQKLPSLNNALVWEIENPDARTSLSQAQSSHSHFAVQSNRYPKLEDQPLPKSNFNRQTPQRQSAMPRQNSTRATLDSDISLAILVTRSVLYGDL